MSHLPLHSNLTHVRVETESGDLLQVMDLAGAKFAELIAAVTDEMTRIKAETGLEVFIGTP